MKFQYFLCIILNLGLYAQNQVNDSLQNPITLDQVTISANKSLEDKRYVSQQIESISLREIRLQNFQNTADLLANSGKLHVQKSQQGGGSPVIRGFEASRVLIMLDGIRLNNLIYRSGHLQSIITIDENVLSNAEIHYGPSSTVYGSDALGGSIHLYTLLPHIMDDVGKIFSGHAFVRYGSANKEKKGHLDFNLSGKKWAVLSSLTLTDLGDLRMGTHALGSRPLFGGRPYYVARIDGRDSLVLNSDSLVQKKSGYKQLDIIQKWLYVPSPGRRHILNLQLSTSTDVPRYDRLTDPANDGIGLNYAEWYYGPQKRMMSAYCYENEQLFDGHKMTLNLAWQQLEESRHQRKFNNAMLQHRTERVNVLNANAGLLKKTRRTDFRYGAEANIQFLKSKARAEDIETGTEESLDTRYPDGANRMKNADVYATATHRITENLSANGGLRIGFSFLHSEIADAGFFVFPFSSITQKNFTYSGSFGLAWLPFSTLKLSAHVSSGFRVPNLDDLSKIFETQAGSLIIPNENLKPEKTLSGDIGIELRSGDHLKWENTCYYTYFNDAIVTVPFSYQGQDSILYDGTLSRVWANQNLRRAFITGFSSMLHARFISHLWSNAQVAYTYGRIKAESFIPLDHISPLYGRLGMRWEAQHYTLDFYSLFNGKKKIEDYLLNGEDNEQYAPLGGMPSWFTLNIKASWVMKPYITIQAGIENIMDIRYRSFSSGINSPGRHIYASLRVRW